MPGINHRNIFKGLGRLQGVLVALADVLCHCNVNDILGLQQLFGKKPLVVLHVRRLGVALPSSGNVHQQLIRLHLLAVQEAAFLLSLIHI